MGVNVRRHFHKFTTILNVLELNFIKRQAVSSKRRGFIYSTFCNMIIGV